MGFFNKILKGLGFEDEEEKPKPTKQSKIKDKKEKLKPNFASFDLKQEPLQEEKQEEVVVEQPVLEQSQNQSALNVIKVNNQVEVQKIVDKIKNGEQVIVNMLALSSADLVRSLDFLTGSVYALNKSMQKVDEAIFIIQ